MRGLRFIPISCTESPLLTPLLREEENSWLQILGWDYAPLQKILVSLMEQKLLPGYVAIQGKEALGYIYFLMNGRKGIVGNIFVRESVHSSEISDELISLSISSLKILPRILSVEAQIMPFNALNYADIFIQKGFRYYPRSYLLLSLDTDSVQISVANTKIVPWNYSRLSQASEIILAGYKNQPDADICSDYRTLSGCESYLRSIMENPGCGIFLPEASFMALDEKDRLKAFILGSRISKGVGMIPQIAVHPELQGQKLGTTLMAQSLEIYKILGFRKIALTVTKENRKAYDWYYRLGFRVCKDFGAFTWNR